MPSGRHNIHAWSHFANFFPNDASQTRHSHSPSPAAATRSSHGGQSSPLKSGEHNHSPLADLNGEQRLSAALLKEERCRPVSPPKATISPIPSTVSQTTTASSPAAMFLSAFMGTKVEPEPLPDDEGQKVGSYTLGKVVGFGAFSTIRRGVSDSGSVVAVKIIRRGDLVRTGHAPEERKRLQHEAEVWSTLSHEHVLPLFSVIHTSYADYFITLFCPAGSLYDILKRDGHPALPQDDAGMMFRQVVRGLRYLHEVALLVHRDMKLENVLVDETGSCRIGDFGLSVKIGDLEDEEALLSDQHEFSREGTYGNLHRTVSLCNPPSKRHPRVGQGLASAIARHNSSRQRSTTCSPTSHVNQPGSLPYAAPELLLPHSFELSPAHPSQDIWALGVMLYALLTGSLPFNDPFEPRLQMKILNGSFEIPQDIGLGAERILNGCLERNIAKRWTISMVDEVAWGVGWGSAGDLATPEESQEDLLNFTPSKLMQSRSTPLDLEIPEESTDWESEERFPRSIIEAGSRRSTSRVQRSLSRAPMVIHGHNANGAHVRCSRPSSPHRQRHRSRSRYFGSASVSRNHSRNHSPVRTPLSDSETCRSRSHSRHRGRQPIKTSYFASRSPSPSIVPSTPVDLSHQLVSRLNLRDPSADLRLDSRSPTRGRARFCLNGDAFEEGDENEADWKGHQSPPLPRAHSREWFPPSSCVSRERSLEGRPNKRLSWTLDNTIRRSRPGSQPPTPGRTWDLFRTKAGTAQPLLSRNGSQDLFLSVLPSTASLAARSRSAECSEAPRPAEIPLSI